jgi:hypothetical protein
MNAVRGEVMAAWAKKEAEMLSGMAEAYGRLI